MEVKLGYGKEKLSVSFEDSSVIGVMTPNEVKIGLTGKDEVVRSLREPIGAPRLSEKVKAGQKVVIVTSDITRPCPSYIIIPEIINELSLAGVPDSDITVVFALGSHRAHTEEEMRHLVGDEVFERVNCIDSDVKDCVHMGTTEKGTPVDVFRAVAEADFKICVGNIEYHYFAGYSGGAKAIMPGVSTRDAIQSNHSRMIYPEACSGNMKNNPVRDDIEEAGLICGIDYIVNVVLSEKKEIICCVSGHHVEAHRAGCAFLDQFYKCKIDEKADIVVVSAGGYPKDLNMYQAQKALDNSKHAVKDGGIIIWLASCAEGLGSAVFERWMTTHPDPSTMITDIKEHFELGGHKAAAVAMVLEKARIFLVSDLDPDFIRSINFEPFSSVEEAMKAAIEAKGKDAKYIVMPFGGSTLPVME
ncbi:MAG: nickel-dependent lactate racemase [Ruminococcaceae bacterium]|nr:nickel-dependent lactate racemase [Oscillospiraceae bacterium]